MLNEHESHEDIFATVRDASRSNRIHVSAKILELLTMLNSRELNANLEKLTELKKVYRLARGRYFDKTIESRISKLRSILAGLNTHKDELCTFLAYRAANTDLLDEPWTWKFGDPFPRRNHFNVASSASSSVGREFSVPQEFQCPISHELMEDPVITHDGFTYDRNNVER